MNMNKLLEQYITQGSHSELIALFRHMLDRVGNVYCEQNSYSDIYYIINCLLEAINTEYPDMDFDILQKGFHQEIMIAKDKNLHTATHYDEAEEGQ